MLSAIAEVRMDVLMLAVMMVVRVRVDGDAARKQARKHRDASEQQEGGCGDVETALPADRHGHTGEVGKHGGC